MNGACNVKFFFGIWKEGFSKCLPWRAESEWSQGLIEGYVCGYPASGGERVPYAHANAV